MAPNDPGRSTKSEKPMCIGCASKKGKYRNFVFFCVEQMQAIIVKKIKVPVI